MNLSDLTGFEIVTDIGEGEAYLMCTLRKCDFEVSIENDPLRVVIDTAVEHRMRHHRD